MASDGSARSSAATTWVDCGRRRLRNSDASRLIAATLFALGIFENPAGFYFVLTVLFLLACGPPAIAGLFVALDRRP
jgi:hypothetical protein